MIKIIGIKCKDKFFVTKVVDSDYRPYYFLEHLIINDNPVKKTFHSSWGVIEDEPKTVQKYVRQPDINQRFELIDPTLESNKIKSVLKRDEVLENRDSDLCWKKEFNIYRSLYTAVSDKCPDILVTVDFTYETIMEVNEIKEYKGFAYDVQRTQWAHEGLRKLKENEIQHQLIDKIIFPDILLPARPCTLTSKQSFDIVREYVKQHINYKASTITSDYNFCFTVRKKILVDDMLSISKIELPKEVECFNMAPKSYQDYKIIKGFKGKNQEDLKNNIDNYCKNLITFINTPIMVCPHCKGRGIVDNEASEEWRI